MCEASSKNKSHKVGVPAKCVLIKFEAFFRSGCMILMQFYAIRAIPIFDVPNVLFLLDACLLCLAAWHNWSSIIIGQVRIVVFPMS